MPVLKESCKKWASEQPESVMNKWSGAGGMEYWYERKGRRQNICTRKAISFSIWQWSNRIHIT